MTTHTQRLDRGRQKLQELAADLDQHSAELEEIFDQIMQGRFGLVEFTEAQCRTIALCVSYMQLNRVTRDLENVLCAWQAAALN